jgi:hypothetical protein
MLTPQVATHASQRIKPHILALLPVRLFGKALAEFVRRRIPTKIPFGTSGQTSGITQQTMVNTVQPQSMQAALEVIRGSIIGSSQDPIIARWCRARITYSISTTQVTTQITILQLGALSLSAGSTHAHAIWLISASVLGTRGLVTRISTTPMPSVEGRMISEQHCVMAPPHKLNARERMDASG